MNEGGKYDIHGLHCNVTDKSERQDVLKYIESTYGKLHVLTLNAGIGGHIGKQFD